MKEEVSADGRHSTVDSLKSESHTVYQVASLADDRMKSNGRDVSAYPVAENNGFHSEVNDNGAKATLDCTAGLKGADHSPLSADAAGQLSAAELKSPREWNVRTKPTLLACSNPIRKITDVLVVNEANGKNLISFAQGDPPTFGPHMKVPALANSALIKVIQDGRNNGYPPSTGLLECRRAVADYLSVGAPYKLTPQDVFMTVGGSVALSLTFEAFAFAGCNILLPKPGYPPYDSLCRYLGAEPRHYDLLQDKSWEVDLDHVAALADENTAALVVTNPGNPTGSVFGYEHLSQIATLAGSLKVPIIADEIYAALAFGKNAKFVSMANFSSTVPVVAIGGISKGWLATGWRVGWIGIWDPEEILRSGKILEALTNMLQITSGPPTPMQAIVPQLVKSTPAIFFEQTCESLRAGADLCYTRANKIQGLYIPNRAEGSMFMMVKIDLPAFKGIDTDVEFATVLLEEESVLVLPGTAFRLPGWFRLVFGLSVSELGEAWDRIEQFCSRHILQL